MNLKNDNLWTEGKVPIFHVTRALNFQATRKSAKISQASQIYS